MALPAPQLGAGQPKVGSQDPEELALAVCGDADGLVVELELNGLFHFFLP
jgi:hypothetical protein